LSLGRVPDYYIILSARRVIGNVSFPLGAQGEAMAEISSGTALRQLQQAHAALKKARQALRMARGDAEAAPGVMHVGWESLVLCHRLLAAIPLSAASEPVMTKQLSVQRYATALLVRLRRLARNEPAAADDDDSADDDDF